MQPPQKRAGKGGAPPLRTWSAAQVGAWLRDTVKLPEYAAGFEKVRVRMRM